MAEAKNPWIELKPPATDYMTYLTFIEHNLTGETLPQLHEILQDKELNVGIGWDLVQTLLPLLPASEECLHDVARLGNPREVVLKVSEALRLLEFESEDEESEEEIEERLGKTSIAESSKAGAARDVERPQAEVDLPLPVVQFKVLLSMLSVLHPRIKTRSPSAFLSTTLQTVLVAYSKISQCQDELTHEVVKFVKTLAGAKRPHLPPRSRSSQILSRYSEASGPDPEAEGGKPSDVEAAIQQRLLQSFLTHILEDYLLGLSHHDDVPGMAWSSKLQEKLKPKRMVEKKTSFKDQFAQSEQLKMRMASIGSIIALAQDLDLRSEELYEVIVNSDPEITGTGNDEENPPKSPKDIPLSKSGSLFLLVARKAVEVSYDRQVRTPKVPIFPDHALIVENFVGSASRSSMGTEPEPLVDAILFLGLLALEDNNIGEPESDEAFCHYLQNTSLLSANTPSPSLRYHAYYLTSTVLRSHPHDLVRLTFIRDTLEHCPYENLKTSAVGWIKGETIEANPPNAHTPTDVETPSIFATPVALATLSPFLFPDLTDTLVTPFLSESYVQFKVDLSFYLAALNFYYLLLIAKHLHEPLDIAGFHEKSNIADAYLTPLKKAVAKYREELKEGGELYDGEVDVHALKELDIMDNAIEHVEGSLKTLRGSSF
ncbi:DUF1760-domain-containing protein [Tothia fuscella]|uniref:DUF1760-domain-containing protein n=1 Tax=Tothia fuscella TaxID=1048955 RepID=A0A9P4NX51_9PEZI|nr:DUF1760-domain-containing protein [Tothia fuscella]